jgi:dihydroorotate dehydrogenase electron transfer subunit
MKLELATVVSQEEAYDNTYLMWLSCPPVARGASAGRFLMLHCGDADDPLLARPMSFHRFRDGSRSAEFAILYDVRGRGTELLSKKRPGDTIRIFGPLGKGYTLRPQTQHVLLVAGGLGVAAVVALADDAIASGKSVTLLHGARTRSALVPPTMLTSEVELMTATDDGSAGHHGYVTQLLAEHLPWADQVFACGPNPMFASMAEEMRKLRSRKPVQALLEERMGCGTGVCYGCAVFTRKGVRLVCKDGPRFELREAFG